MKTCAQISHSEFREKIDVVSPNNTRLSEPARVGEFDFPK